jgi:chorismate dehydratase
LNSQNLLLKALDTFAPASKLALGHIDFVNCLPLTVAMERHPLPNLELVMASPNELNKRYQRGELTLGAMSSFYFLSQSQLSLLPVLSISGTRQVGSVLYFGRRSCRKGSGEKDTPQVFVPSTSASSIGLLRLLFLLEEGVSPDFIINDQVRPCDLFNCDGSVRGLLTIGDWALLDDASPDTRELLENELLERLDLGQWWFEKFGLPMVFGVWAFNEKTCPASALERESLGQYLQEMVKLGLTDYFEEVLERAQKRVPIGRSILTSYYLEDLSYRFDHGQSKSLALFHRLLQENAILPGLSG